MVEELGDYAAQGEDVDLRAVFFCVDEEFRGSVPAGAHVMGVWKFTSLLCESEITEFDFPVGEHQYILRFDITMHAPVFMQVLHPLQQPPGNLPKLYPFVIT